MCSKQDWKKEFQCSSFGLEYEPSRHFVTFEFGYPKLCLLWRGILAAYHVAMLVLTGFLDLWVWTRTDADRVKWFVYLTHWAYFALTLSAVFDFLSQVAVYIRCPGIISSRDTKMPVFLKVSWVLYNVAINSSALISILFWALLYTPGKFVSNIDMITHVGNLVSVVVNLFLTATPVRFYHFFHTLIFAVVYVVFTVIYYFAGGTNGLGYDSVYPVLDWGQPGTAALYSCVTSLVGVPVIQFVFMLLARLRKVLFSLCCKKQRREDGIAMENKGYE